MAARVSSVLSWARAGQFARLGNRWSTCLNQRLPALPERVATVSTRFIVFSQNRLALLTFKPNRVRSFHLLQPIIRAKRSLLHLGGTTLVLWEGRVVRQGGGCLKQAFRPDSRKPALFHRPRLRGADQLRLRGGGGLVSRIAPASQRSHVLAGSPLNRRSHLASAPVRGNGGAPPVEAAVPALARR